MKFNNIYEGLSGLAGTPAIIPTFNNPTYTKYMVGFLKNHVDGDIVILDNKSTYGPMIELLDELSLENRVIVQDTNFGPRQLFNDANAFELLPEYFVFTDPDLKFSDSIPSNFIEVFKNILDTSAVFKVGCALDISIEENTVLNNEYFVGGNPTTIKNIESQYYNNLDGSYPDYLVFNAPIDTTFALYKKSNIVNGFFSAKRVGGEFSAIHCGWDVIPPIPQEEYKFYTDTMGEDFSSTEVLKRDGSIW